MRTKNDLTQAIILRESGHILSSIVERTGLSASTLYRHFRKLDVARGSITRDTLESARQKLFEDSGLVGDLKQQIASQINDDLALARSIREGLTLALESLVDDAGTPATLKARSYAAIATSLKSTSDLMRRALALDDASMTTQELPIIKIWKMTDKEVETEQSRLKELAEDK